MCSVELGPFAVFTAVLKHPQSNIRAHFFISCSVRPTYLYAGCHVANFIEDGISTTVKTFFSRLNE